MNIAKLSPAVIASAGIANFGFAAIVGGHIPDSTWIHIGNWLHDFTTGPGMAGIFAVVAAGIAYRGIKQQVDKTAEANRNVATANEETARKNRDDQWWATLKWTYEEAKESPNGQTTAFQSIAAAQILTSLNDAPELLSVQQRRAVEAIGNIFDRSRNPEVRGAVRPIFEASGVTAPSEYADALALALQQLTFRSAVTIRRSGSFDVSAQSSEIFEQSQVFDLTLRSEEGKEVAITVLTFSPLDNDPEFSFDARTVFNTSHGSSFAQARLREFVKDDPDNRAALFIMNWPQLGPKYEKYDSIIESMMQREREFITTLTWRAGEDVDEIEAVLRRAFEGRKATQEPE